jgi:hypothetical protein
MFRFSEEKDLDYENYHLALNGGYRLSQRLNLSGDVLYTKDTTLDSELEETGRIVERDNREWYRGGGALAYALNEVSNIDLEYQYQSTEYESDNRVDRVTHRFRLPYSRWFNDRLDQLTLRPSYTKSKTENNRDIEYYNLSVGWMHIFSKTLRMNNFVGYGYTVSTENGDRDRVSTGNADLSITQTAEIFSFRIGLRSYINLDAEGDLREVDRRYCTVRKWLTERVSARLDASVYINRPIDTYDSADSVYYDIKPQLSWELTENFSLNTFYRYSLEEDRAISKNQDSTRNIIEANLAFQFPMQK